MLTSKSLNYGYFITYEGIDGAGKSSHIEPTAERLRQLGYEVVVTREPGGTPLAEKLRALVLGDEMDLITETLLAFASRNEHIKKVILPALQAGKTVLCDRFTDSTMAYQGYGRGASKKFILELEQKVQSIQFIVEGERLSHFLTPDLTLWFDLDPAVAAARLAGARAPDRFESLSKEFFERVRAGYADRMACTPERFRIIKADQPQADVAHDVREAIDVLCAAPEHLAAHCPELAR